MAVSVIFFALWLVSMPAYCLIRLLAGGVALDFATAFVAANLFAFSLSHCIETRGTARSLAMLSVAFAVALGMEYLGSAHGFLFGDYDYTDRLGPKALGQVPIIIPVAWFMMLYPAWEVGGLLASKLQHKAASSVSIALPLLRIAIAALAMTAWDLSLDPRMTADGAWIWHDGGAYFGVPLTNFLGWFVTSAMIYAIWMKLDNTSVIPNAVSPVIPVSWFRNGATGSRENPAPVTVAAGLQGFLAKPRNDNRWGLALSHAALPVLAYSVQWLGESMANAVFWGGPLVAVCVFVAMGMIALPAATWLLKGRV